LTLDPLPNSMLCCNMNQGTRGKIKLLICWISIKQDNHELATESDWNALTVDVFNDFRLQAKIVDPSVANNSNTLNHQHNNQGANNNDLISACQELEAFKQGLKQDGALYPTFRKKHTWDNWHRSMMAQAQAHDVAEVLDGTYNLPNDEVNKALFDQK
jgi:hypothetical protein